LFTRIFFGNLIKRLLRKLVFIQQAITKFSFGKKKARNSYPLILVLCVLAKFIGLQTATAAFIVHKENGR